MTSAGRAMPPAAPFEVRLPLEQQVAAHILRRQAAALGDRTFVTFAGRDISYRSADASADAFARAAAVLGIGRGTRVGVLLRNRPEYLDLWFGLTRIAAIQVPINTAYRAPQIRHVLMRAPVPVVVAQADLVEPLLEVIDEIAAVETLVVLGDARAVRSRTAKRVLGYDDVLAAGTGRGLPEATVGGQDTGAVMNTSGTTGPSKGVLLSHAQQYLLGWLIGRDLGLTAGDVYYNCFPLFHNTAQAMITLPVLMAGGRMVLVERFSASGFWPDVRAHGCTVFYYIGEILRMLLASTTTADAHGARLRVGWGIGAAPRDFLEFQRLHGVALRSGYGSTEANVPVYLPHEHPDPRTVGRCVEGFELRVVDERDVPLAPGETGEIVVRSSWPSAIMQGYDGDPAATIAAWRDLWFHTGDAGRLDEHGNLIFSGRVRDAIRVRGENVSAFEVEEVIAELPGVAEVAAIAVPCELGGDDVKVVLVAAAGAQIDPVAVIEHAGRRLPKFAVPRYVELVATLPKTETNKVRKNVLRETPFTPSTWDRLAGAPGHRDRRPTKEPSCST